MRPLETSLFRHEAENEIKVTCERLKNRFLDLNQVAFWDGPEAENVFKEL